MKWLLVHHCEYKPCGHTLPADNLVFTVIKGRDDGRGIEDSDNNASCLHTCQFRDCPGMLHLASLGKLSQTMQFTWL